MESMCRIDAVILGKFKSAYEPSGFTEEKEFAAFVLQSVFVNQDESSDPYHQFL